MQDALQVICALQLFLLAEVMLPNWSQLQASALDSVHNQSEEALSILTAGCIIKSCWSHFCIKP